MSLNAKLVECERRNRPEAGTSEGLGWFQPWRGKQKLPG